MTLTLDALQRHPVFKISNDFTPISSPADVGYSRDSVLSAFKFLAITPGSMAQSGMRGETFAVVRYVPYDPEYPLAPPDTSQARADTVYFRKINGNWILHKLGSPISVHEFAKFYALARGKSVRIDGTLWKRA